MILIQSYVWKSDIVKANIRNVDLNLLVVLDTLYEERSVTRTAERLALTQPTVSGMLKRLREIFGDDLFIRTSDGVIPTPRADGLAPSISAFVAAARTVLIADEFDPAKDRFGVTLSGSDYLHNTLVSAFAAAILNAAPNAQVVTTTHPVIEAEQLLTRGDVDFFFNMGDVASKTFPGQVLFHDTIVCVSTYKAHRVGQHLTAAELCDLRHVYLGSVGQTRTPYVNDALAEKGLRREICLTVPNLGALFRVLRDVELIAFIPLQLARLHEDWLKQIETDLDIRSIPVVTNWHPRMSQDARHVWLRDLLQKTADAQFA